MSFDTGGHQSHEPGSHAARQRQIDWSRTELLGGPSAQTGRPHHADQSAETATPVAQEGYLIIAQVKRGHFWRRQNSTRSNEETSDKVRHFVSYASSPPLRTCDNCKKYDPWRKNPLSLLFRPNFASSFVQLDPSRRLSCAEGERGARRPDTGGTPARQVADGDLCFGIHPIGGNKRNWNANKNKRANYTKHNKKLFFFFQKLFFKKTRNSEILSSTIFQTGCSPFLMIHFFLFEILFKKMSFSLCDHILRPMMSYSSNSCVHCYHWPVLADRSRPVFQLFQTFLSPHCTCCSSHWFNLPTNLSLAFV